MTHTGTRVRVVKRTYRFARPYTCCDGKQIKFRNRLWPFFYIWPVLYRTGRTKVSRRKKKTSQRSTGTKRTIRHTFACVSINLGFFFAQSLFAAHAIPGQRNNSLSPPPLRFLHPHRLRRTVKGKKRFCAFHWVSTLLYDSAASNNNEHFRNFKRLPLSCFYTENRRKWIFEYCYATPRLELMAMEELLRDQSNSHRNSCFGSKIKPT